MEHIDLPLNHLNLHKNSNQTISSFCIASISWKKENHEKQILIELISETYKWHFSVEMLITPSKSSCSKFGHKLAIDSKSRSVKPRIAAKNNFFRFGQLFKSCRRLSPGDASSRKLFYERNYSIIFQRMTEKTIRNLPPTKINFFKFSARRC